jgi:hypothetical protein
MFGRSRAVNERLTRTLPLLTAAAIAIGGAAHLAGAPRAGEAIWAAALAVAVILNALRALRG